MTLARLAPFPIVVVALLGAFVAPGHARQTATGGHPAAATRTNLTYADAKPIIDALREDYLPIELRSRSGADREASWAAWA
jgi:hypothetical protein